MAGGDVSVVVYVDDILDALRAFLLLLSALVRVQAATSLLQETVGGAFDIIPKPGFSILLIALPTQTFAPSF